MRDGAQENVGRVLLVAQESLMFLQPLQCADERGGPGPGRTPAKESRNGSLVFWFGVVEAQACPEVAGEG